MWFRNLRAWQLQGDWTMEPERLGAALEPHIFAPCAPGQESTLGWEPPVADLPEELARQVAGRTVLRARQQERILPASAINELLPERLAEEEAREGRPLRAAERRELQDNMKLELMPRALLKSMRHWLVIDPHTGLIMIDTTQEKRAEALLSLLRDALQTLPVRPLRFAQPVDTVLTEWVRSGDLPSGLQLGGWCDMEDPEDTRNKVKFRNQPLDEDEVGAALDRGLRVTALELIWQADGDEPFSCVLAEDGSLKRIQLPAAEADEHGSDESEAARLDAEIALLTLTLQRFFGVLFPALGGLEAIE